MCLARGLKEGINPLTKKSTLIKEGNTSNNFKYEYRRDFPLLHHVLWNLLFLYQEIWIVHPLSCDSPSRAQVAHFTPSNSLTIEQGVPKTTTLGSHKDSYFGNSSLLGHYPTHNNHRRQSFQPSPEVGLERWESPSYGPPPCSLLLVPGHKCPAPRAIPYTEKAI